MFFPPAMIFPFPIPKLKLFPKGLDTLGGNREIYTSLQSNLKIMNKVIKQKKIIMRELYLVSSGDPFSSVSDIFRTENK